MPAPRRALALIVALTLLAAPAARAQGAPGPQLIAARADDAGVELLLSCPPGAPEGFQISLDGGPALAAASAPVALAPALAIVVGRGPGLGLAGTPASRSADDALGQIDALLARLPAGGAVTAISYAEGGAALLAPLRADPAGARAALAVALQAPAARPPAPPALGQALDLARAQLLAAPAGPAAVVILAADSPGPIAAPAPTAPAVLTVVGLSADAEEGLRAAATALGGDYLPYHSPDLAALPALLDALAGRYAALGAPGAGLRVSRPLAGIAPGRHQVAASGCGGQAEAWLEIAAPTAPGPASLAGAGLGGVALGLAAAALAGRLRRRSARSGAAPAAGRAATAPYQRLDGSPTERGPRLLSGPAAPRYRLIIWDGDRRTGHELRERQCVIGRDPGCDLPIDNRWLSALHARLTISGEQISLTDLDSSNGTTLGSGGPRLAAHQPATLHEGDEIWLGPEVRAVLRRAEGEERT
jgi:hypothetical protein